MSVIDFLTGGVFTSLKDLIINIFEYIIRFATNIISILLSPILNGIYTTLPFIDNLSGKLEAVFNYASPFINFILDLSFLSSPIILYLVGSIIARITLRFSTYVTKVIYQWYDKIKP